LEKTVFLGLVEGKVRNGILIDLCFPYRETEKQNKTKQKPCNTYIKFVSGAEGIGQW
jgi:hypothetical protein